jgi:hypothetical protein
MEHDLYQTRRADRLLQQKDVVIRSEIHCLCDDAIVGMRSVADRPPTTNICGQIPQ